MAWKSQYFDLSILMCTSQIIHCFVKPKSINESFHYTFVYAFNANSERIIPLWNDLMALSVSINDPWIVMGDFNCILEAKERIGAAVTWKDMADFRDCIKKCGLYDMKYGGNFFTWNNKQCGDARVFLKIDRGM